MVRIYKNDNTFTILNLASSGGGAVSSVNGQTGDVIVDLQSATDEGNTTTNDLVLSTNNALIQGNAGTNGLILKNLKNNVASTLSGTALTIELNFGGVPYYLLAYPASTQFSGVATISTDHSQLSGSVSNYALMIRVTNNNLKTVANGGMITSSSGYDIIPYSDVSLTTPITFAREFWNGSTGELVMWLYVNISASANDTFYLAYGNPNITTDQSNVAAVWTGFGAVWPLADGTTLSLTDVTGNGNNGTNHSATATTGVIDGAAAGTGGQYIDFGTALYYGTGNFSIGAWVKTSSATRQAILNKYFTTDIGYFLDVLNTGVARYVAVNKTSSDLIKIDGSTNIADGNWHYVVGVRTGAHTGILYIDGVAEGTHTELGNPDITTPAVHLYIGKTDGGYTANLEGSVDLPRIIGSALSADYVKADYVSQNPSSTFLTITF